MRLRNLGTALLRGIQNNIPIPQLETLSVSEVNGKRFKIRNPDGTKWIHFGLYPFKKGAYIDHNNDEIRKAWFARHSQIYLERNGSRYKAINYPNSPDYYSARILW
jgi:hypothetical protein